MKHIATILASLALATTAAFAAKTAATVTSNCGYITWTLDKAYPVGQFVNGDWWVIGDPVKVVAITNTLSDPAYLDLGDVEHSGSMINPLVEGGQEMQPGEQPRGFNARVGAHGYDSRVEFYHTALNAARPGGKPVAKDNPIVLKPDQSLVSKVSYLWRTPDDKEPGCPTVGNGGGITRPTMRVGAVLTVLASAPPEGTFRPSYAGNEKRLLNISQLKRDRLRSLPPVDHIYAGTGDIEDIKKTDRIPSWSTHKTAPPFTIPGHADERSLYWAYLYGADIALMTKATSRAWIDHIPSWYGSTFLHPALNISNYGRESNHLLQCAMLALHLDWTKIPGAPESKDALIINMCQIGIDTAGAADAGSWWMAGMGHHAGRKPIILFAGLLLDDAHMKNVGHWKTEFQDDHQLLYITQQNVDYTNSEAWRPDTRGLHLAPYNETMIGMPEWVGKQAGWNVAYRDINNSYITGFALTFLMMEDGVKLWNNQVQFDYADRANGAIWEATKTLQQNHAPAFVRAMWDAYRKDYPSTYDRKWDDEKIVAWCTTPSFMLRPDNQFNVFNADAPVRMTVGAQVDLSTVTPDTVAVTSSNGDTLTVAAIETAENPGKFFTIKFAEGTELKKGPTYTVTLDKAASADWRNAIGMKLFSNKTTFTVR